ncbi:hypothetical protein [Celeribacter sp. HF31]|uniref:hypothetical protein n=1 Tax=Celeribacter sp. HF31 TaxID=2721558 RepID=UPI0034C6BAB7
MPPEPWSKPRRSVGLWRALAGANPADAANFSASALADRWETQDTKDGIAAFFAKKEPPWRHG